jgi:NAD+ diphosphatase
MSIITPNRPNSYTGGRLDRASHQRDDVAFIQAALHDPASRFIPYWRGKNLIAGIEAGAPCAVLISAPALGAPWVFIGIQDRVAMFGIDLSVQDEPAVGDVGSFVELRALRGSLPTDDAVLLGTARGLLYWQSRQKFCGVCGAACLPVKAGHTMQCTGCHAEHFPRTDPAVIMLITKGNKVLLGQSHKFPVERNFYSTLAGFVEPGESLEEAVRREVLEEVGVQVGHVHYHSSQPWPFPASLMLGFHGIATSETITLDQTEMRDARWFTPEDIANRRDLGFNLPPHDSIARRLIDDWLSVIGAH